MLVTWVNAKSCTEIVLLPETTTTIFPLITAHVRWFTNISEIEGASGRCVDQVVKRHPRRPSLPKQPSKSELSINDIFY